MQKGLKKLDGIDCSEVLNKPVLPSAYFAPIEYYAILLKYKDCKIEYHENFIKQTIRNRCYIYGANGKLCLTIPKERKGSSKKIIKEIKICYHNNWKKEHWNSIKFSYNSSPFFKYYKDQIKNIFLTKKYLLVDFNYIIQKEILSILNEEYNTIKTNKFIKSGNFSDLRNYKSNMTSLKEYYQVFSGNHGFIENLSILDLIFNLGPESTQYLKSINI